MKIHESTIQQRIIIPLLDYQLPKNLAAREKVSPKRSASLGRAARQRLSSIPLPTLGSSRLSWETVVYVLLELCALGGIAIALLDPWR